MKRYKKYFLTAHLYISLFFIPMAVFYKITGGIAIFQYFGKQDSVQLHFTQEQARYFQGFDYARGENGDMPNSASELELAREQILQFLLQHHIEIPLSTRISERWDHRAFMLGNVAHYIEIDKRAPQALSILRRDTFANLITLHFGRAGVAFNILALAFVVFLGITYITGILLCPFSKNRLKYSLTIALGFVVMLACMAVGVYM